MKIKSIKKRVFFFLIFAGHLLIYQKAFPLTHDVTIEKKYPLDFLKKIRDLFFHYFPQKQNVAFIPVTFDSGGLPLIKVEIEEDEYTVMVDLGSYVQMNLESDILNKIHKKSYGLARFEDFKGNSYESKQYLIPEIKIGNMVFYEIIVKEENEDFNKKVVIWKKFESSLSNQNGAIGRSLLKRKNVLLDFPHARMAFVENTNSLKDIPFHLENRVTASFEMTSTGIILSVETDIGEKKFLLDSGFTENVLESSQIQNQSCHKDFRDLTYFTASQFVIGGNDFGNTKLYLLDIKLQEEDIDGILGMDFICNHTIYIDFSKKMLLIGDVN